MKKIHIIHYLNQFFAGIGGEDQADSPLDFIEGPVGPGRRIQTLLGARARIAVTAYCGDNYFVEHHDEVLEKILQFAEGQDFKMVIAGPAFAAGRYGFGCIETCRFLSKIAGLKGVTAMHPENPGVESYRQYKDENIFLLPASETISGMEDSLSRMAELVLKLVSGSKAGSASEWNYIPRGIRVDEFVPKVGAERTIDMLLDKIAGRSFVSEIPIEAFERVPVAPPITNVKNAQLAIVSTSGVVPLGNPDGFKGYRNNQWRKYPLDELDSMEDSEWDVIHTGYNTKFMYQNPNYGVPLDACREFEKKDIFVRFYPHFYGMTGVQALISNMERIGREIALDMEAEGVEGVLLVST
jgi:glycine reductase